MYDTKQIIPFPLPEYLREFVVSQLESPVELLEDGTAVKALHITRRSPFGKFIHRCLKKANRPAFAKKGYTMFVAVSNYSRINDEELPDGRYSFLDLEESEVKEITAVFKAWFNSSLLHFVEGAKFAHEHHGKEKGIVHASIIEFINRYEITHDKNNFNAFVKYYQREKKAQRLPLQRLI